MELNSYLGLAENDYFYAKYNKVTEKTRRKR